MDDAFHSFYCAMFGALFMGLLKPKAGATRLVNIALHHSSSHSAAMPELKELHYQFEHLLLRPLILLCFLSQNGFSHSVAGER